MKQFSIVTLTERFMGPTWGPSGADRTQVGPMLDPWNLLSGEAPAHMSEILQLYTPCRKLRSVDNLFPMQSPCRLKSNGDHTLNCAASAMWNNLHHNVKTTKSVDTLKEEFKIHFHTVTFWVILAWYLFGYTLADCTLWLSMDWISLCILNARHYCCG